jgi:hypothetical protein
MAFDLRRLSAHGVVVVAALAVAACGGGSKTSTTTSSGTLATTTSSSAPATTTSTSARATVIGRSTSVVLSPAITAALKHADITVTALAPASSKTHNTLLIFPAAGGQIVTATGTGTIDNIGGLTFSHAGKSVTVTSLIVNTSAKQVIAEVGRKQVTAFDLNLASLKRASRPKGTVVASGIKLTTTPQLASSLNTRLGVNTFKGGQDFGIATLTIAVKP